MPKYKSYKDYSTGGETKYFVNSPADFMDLTRFPADFKSFRELFGNIHPTEAKAKSYAKELFDECIEMIVHDLIYNRDEFTFPAQGFGMIKVDDITDVDDPNYSFDINLGGKKYGLKSHFSTKMFKKNKKFWTARFTQENMLKLYKHLTS